MHLEDSLKLTLAVLKCGDSKYIDIYVPELALVLLKEFITSVNYEAKQWKINCYFSFTLYKHLHLTTF